MSSRPQRTFAFEPATADEHGKTVIRVRRGALRRFDQLTKKSADLPVEIKWDRRTTERRGQAQPAGPERRSEDRRQAPPFTWDAADFVVEGDRPREPEDSVEPRRARAPKARR